MKRAMILMIAAAVVAAMGAADARGEARDSYRFAQSDPNAPRLSAEEGAALRQKIAERQAQLDTERAGAVAQAPTPTTAGVRWEYAAVSDLRFEATNVHIYSFESPDELVRHETRLDNNNSYVEFNRKLCGGKLPEYQAAPNARLNQETMMLNAVGARGWELVSTRESGDGASILETRYLFKRPR